MFLYSLKKIIAMKKKTHKHNKPLLINTQRSGLCEKKHKNTKKY